MNISNPIGIALPKFSTELAIATSLNSCKQTVYWAVVKTALESFNPRQSFYSHV